MIESPFARLAAGNQPARFQPPAEVYRVDPPKRNATASIAPIRAPLALTPGFSPVANPLDSSVDGSPLLRPMFAPLLAPLAPRISEESARTRHYTAEEFFAFKDERCHTPGAVLEWAINKYQESHLPFPVHLALAIKESDDERALGGQCKKGRMRAVRQIHHKVMSILSRITGSKYDSLRDEMMELPLRQSSSEELKDIVKVFFEKAVQEVKFSDLYAKLAGELCKQTEAEKAMPKEDQQKLLSSRMRTGLLHACQDEFSRPLQLQDSDLVDSTTGERLGDEVIEQKRTRLKKRLVGNIKFVGELYLMGLLSNSVIDSIFKQLIMDFDPAEPRKKDEYLFEVFATLFTTTVHKFLQHNPESVARIGEKVQEIEAHHPTTRVQFQMLDIVEMRDNGWKKGGAPVLRPSQSTDRLGSGTSLISTPTSGQPPQTPTGRNSKRGTPSHLDPTHVQSASTPSFRTGNTSKASSTLPTPINTNGRTGAYRPPGATPVTAATPVTTTRTTTTSTNISTTNTPSKSKPPTALNIAPTMATLVSDKGASSSSSTPTNGAPLGQGMGARRQSSGSKLSPSHSAASGPQSPLTNARNPIWGYTSPNTVDGKKMRKTVEGYVEQYRTEPEEVLKSLAEVERKELVVVIAHWIHLCLVETRRIEDRQKLPTLFAEILERCESPARIILTSSDLLSTIKEAISFEVDGGSYEHCPKLFANWSMIVTEAFKIASGSVKNGRVSPKMARVLLVLNGGTFTRWLGCLVNKHDRAIHTAVRDLSVAAKEIIKMCDALAEDSPTKVLQYAILNRFRILPYLLKLEGGRIRTPTTPLHLAADLGPTSSPTLAATDAYQQCFALVGDDAELQQFKRVLRGEQDFCAIAPNMDAVSGNSQHNVTLVQTAMKLTSATLALLYPPKTETPKITSEQSLLVIKDTLSRMPDRMRGAAEAAVVTEMIYFFCCDVNKATNPGYNSLANSMSSTPMKTASMSPSRSFDGATPNLVDDSAALGAACECFRRWVDKDVIRRGPVLELLGGIAPPRMPSTPGTPPRAYTYGDLDGSFSLPGPDMGGPFGTSTTSNNQRSLAGSPTGLGPQRDDPNGPSTPLVHARAGTPVGASSCPGTPNVTMSASANTYFFDEGEMLVRNLNAVSTLHWHKIIARLQKA